MGPNVLAIFRRARRLLALAGAVAALAAFVVGPVLALGGCATITEPGRASASVPPYGVDATFPPNTPTVYLEGPPDYKWPANWKHRTGHNPDGTSFIIFTPDPSQPTPPRK